MSFFFENTETEPSLEHLLALKEEEIKTNWSLIQNEAECDFEDADLGKIAKLIKCIAELNGEILDLKEGLGCCESAQRGVMCRAEV